MRRLASRLFWIGATVVLAVPAVAAVISQIGTREVIYIAPFAPEIVELNRSAWRPGDPVAEIYGQPSKKPMRVLFADGSKIVVPREDPSLALLRVEPGEHPWQWQTLWFFAGWIVAAGLVPVAIGAAMLLFWNR